MESQKTLLFVDDNRLILASFSKSLSRLGYVVHTSDNADEAEDILASGLNPDLAILDIQMPKRDGISLASRLRLLDNIPFMFLSAYADQEYVEKASILGALGYLVKPVDVDQLVPAIESAIARANEIQELKETRKQLQQALDHERDINVLIGITMSKNKIPRQQAFELLRSIARNDRVKLGVMASKMIQELSATSQI